jgi:ABC-type phosphate/phosphonate transport system substrate-binding protein
MKGERLTWVLGALVVATAVSAVFPRGGPQLPGMIRFGVLAGAGVVRTERALTPLTDYLGLAVRRAMRPEVVSVDRLRADAGGFDLALLPSTFLDSWGSGEVLAWGKPRGMPGARTRPYALFRRKDPWYDLDAPRVIFGDRFTWSGGAGSDAYLAEHGFGSHEELGGVQYGSDPYDHTESIAALVHGAFDLAIVRESDLREALETGLVDRSRFAFTPAGPAHGDFVLVAGATLSSSARRRIRDAVLNLDLYRYDETNQRVQAILASLDPLGLSGFVPDEVLPSLRP